LDVYGSSRLGLLRTAVDVEGAAPVTKSLWPPIGMADSLIFTRGNKLFELTNHLGNVLSTISDKRYGVSTNDSTVTYFIPEVVNANDYYPFGSLQPNRCYTENGATGYRYGFNGQEKSDEIKGQGNSYTAEFWEYDPRVGRRWNADIVVKPESPYASFANNPINLIDPNGADTTSPMEAVVVIGKVKKKQTSGSHYDYSPPRYSLRVGDTWGPVGPNHSTSIWPIFGGRRYYNSTIWGPPGTGLKGLIANFSELNLHVQFQWLTKYNEQFGINWFKQKFDGYANRFRYEAPTAAEFSYTFKSFSILNMGNIGNISGNLTFSGGPTFGFPLFDSPYPGAPPAGTVLNVNPVGIGRYRFIGAGASTIQRIDFKFLEHYTFFIAGTVHYLQVIQQNTSVGEQPSRGFVSGAIELGAGVDIGKR
jgi:RHS repeat-associated protein